MELSDKHDTSVSRAAGAFAVSRLITEAGNAQANDPMVRHSSDSANRSIRVIKIGGSLLTWDQAPKNIRDWLAQQPEMTNVWIAGGGELADYVRRWHRQFPLDPSTAHWACIDGMSINTRLLKSWFPDWRMTDGFAALISSSGKQNILFDPSSWLRSNLSLPESWQVTSDACGGFLAEKLLANEYVILKSCVVTPFCDVNSLASAGIVDEALPQIARRLPKVRLVNVRDPLLSETVLDGIQQVPADDSIGS